MQALVLAEDAMTELEEGFAALEESAIELEDGFTELEEGLAELDEGFTELDDGLMALELTATLEELYLRNGLVNFGAPGVLQSTGLFTVLCDAI